MTELIQITYYPGFYNSLKDGNKANGEHFNILMRSQVPDTGQVPVEGPVDGGLTVR
jgi:hypothetical protein